MTSPDDAVIIALGSSLNGAFGAAEDPLRAALAALVRRGVRVTAVSRLWRSLAWPDPSNPPFLNAAALIETARAPEGLLEDLQAIEQDLGRTRSVPNAPRIIDLDLIAYGRRRLQTPTLTLPHPRAAERRFVMGPLSEIAPLWRHPVLGETAARLAATASVGRDAEPLVSGELDVAQRASSAYLEDSLSPPEDVHGSRHR